MTALEYFLAYDFARWQLLAALVVALLCSALGVYVVLRGMSMLGDGLAHISFAGIALGLVLGLHPLPVAFALALAGALVIQALRSRQIVRGDAAIGILFTAGLALGVLLVSKAGGTGVNAQAYLFGNLASVQRQDAWLVSGLGLLLVLVLALFHKELLSITFHEEAARLSGVPVALVNTLFTALTAASIVVAARVVGVLLVSALLVVPAAASLQLARSFRAAVLLSVGFGLLSVLAGVYASTEHGLPTGASVALAATLLFALVVGGKTLAAGLRSRG